MNMLCASMWSFLCAMLLVLVLQAAEVSSSSNIALNIVSVADEGESLLLTVTYSSGPDTQPSWVLTAFTSKGLTNLDFEVENSFANGEGRSSARIAHEETTRYLPLLTDCLLILRNQDCEVGVNLPSFDTLRTASPSSHNFRGISLSLQRGNRVLKPGQNLAFRKPSQRRIRLDAVLSSPELAAFDIGLPIMWHSRVEEEDGGGLPVWKDSYGHKDQDPINATSRLRGWKDRGSTKRMSLQLKNVQAVSGVLKVWALNLRHRHVSFVASLEFKQNLYIQRRRGEEAVPYNTVVLKTRRFPDFRTEYDVSMSLRIPNVNLVAIGNPPPIITLRRKGDCDSAAAGNSADVEIVETKRASKYEVNHFFRLKNASEALPGSYTVVARSGLMEVREILSIGLVQS